MNESMTYSQLLIGLRESGLSPEQLAARLQISHMTFRRWMKRPGIELVARSYLPQIAETVYGLLAEGLLDPKSEATQGLMREFRSKSFSASLQTMGVAFPRTSHQQSNQQLMTLAIRQIGEDSEHRVEIVKSGQKIASFESFGPLWASHIQRLWAVVKSSKLNLADKSVAFGALFYLIFPFDLIPDSIPVVGYLDDFAVLAIAVAYYQNMFIESNFQTSAPTRNLDV